MDKYSIIILSLIISFLGITANMILLAKTILTIIEDSSDRISKKIEDIYHITNITNNSVDDIKSQVEKLEKIANNNNNIITNE